MAPILGLYTPKLFENIALDRDVFLEGRQDQAGFLAWWAEKEHRALLLSASVPLLLLLLILFQWVFWCYTFGRKKK